MSETERRLRVPWIYLGAGLVALVIQLFPEWRGALLYDRAAIATGELWRLWSGHWVHFGWPHFVADTGLLLILGWVLEKEHRRFAVAALVAMPVFISACLYFLDSSMPRYGGLSALNLGLLLYLALQGWQRNWMDWFWPAVLVIYVGELVYEIVQGGRGGGFIQFDDQSIRVATSAHIAGAVYAIAGWLLARRRARREPAAT
jgi:rhomboid family GlyGly-CTERM serine protease